ncbi:MAG: class II glutamine amidotransferase [Gemmatimonadota bacterium]|nr:MAG: class II glutamine amidotransferase [Gemmatimonadota bacterium]
MCRWLGYSGAPLYLDELLFKPKRSLIQQSLQARGGSTTNGDGFGIGWYGEKEEPGLFKALRPAWNDANLRSIAAQVRSPLFLAHVRAATGSAIQRTNCHPFQHGRWLFVHNGEIRGFRDIRRDLVLSVDPALFPEIEGTTDTEVMLHLALTLGLETEPVAAMERMVGLVEEIGGRHGVEHPISMTVGITDGDRIFAFRYSSERASFTLYHSVSMQALRELDPGADKFSDDARLVVSEPLTELSSEWIEIPESSALVVEAGEVELQGFTPIPPD